MGIAKRAAAGRWERGSCKTIEQGISIPIFAQGSGHDGYCAALNKLSTARYRKPTQLEQ